MKKILFIVVMLAAGSFILSSCSGGSGAKSSKTETSENANKQLTVNIENGEAVYKKVCIACHMTGVAGAPALNNKERWSVIAKKGMKKLHHDAINGYTGDYGVMPPKGTCMDCSDQDLYDAIGYMLKEAGFTASAD
ncbi:MAG: c-type cytochrome [Chlorobi bacterium]|nr:c-type cytochrome [Chlorobiota bacterium]